MKHDGTLDNRPFRGTLYIYSKARIEQLLHNNHKHGSQPTYFNKNKDTFNNIVPPMDRISHPHAKVNSIHFYEPYYHINPM